MPRMYEQKSYRCSCSNNAACRSHWNKRLTDQPHLGRASRLEGTGHRLSNYRQRKSAHRIVSTPTKTLRASPKAKSDQPLPLDSRASSPLPTPVWWNQIYFVQFKRVPKIVAICPINPLGYLIASRQYSVSDSLSSIFTPSDWRGRHELSDLGWWALRRRQPMELVSSGQSRPSIDRKSMLKYQRK